MLKLVDCHSHLSDERLANHVDEIISDCLRLGFSYFLQAGVSPNDWGRQKELKVRYPEQVGLCFGLHPYFVSENSESDCESALDILAKNIGQAQALGEAGLDFRTQWLATGKEKQIRFFEMQLELAEAANKPVIMHIVRAHQEAIGVIDHWGRSHQGKVWGMVHSFNGSSQQCQQFIERKLLISVGAAILKPDNLKLRQAVKDMPLDFLLLESDSPDQKPWNWPKPHNDPRSIIWVAEEISCIKKMSVFEVLDKCRQNFENHLL